MTKNEIILKVQNLKVWKKENIKAPHKPLLLLLSISRLMHGCDRLATFEEINAPLKDLLIKFGPKRKTYHPEYPFWRLQNDGLWELSGSEQLKRRKGHTDPLKSELIKRNIRGGFPKKIYFILESDRNYLEYVILSILNLYFKKSLHKIILSKLDILQK